MASSQSTAVTRPALRSASGFRPKRVHGAELFLLGHAVEKQLLADSVQHRLGVFGGDTEKNAGGAGGLTAPLLPIAQRGGADAEGRGKLRLAEMELRSDSGHGLGIDVIDAGGGFFVSAQVGTGFADTLKEILKIGVFHGIRL